MFTYNIVSQAGIITSFASEDRAALEKQAIAWMKNINSSAYISPAATNISKKLEQATALEEVIQLRNEWEDVIGNALVIYNGISEIPVIKHV